MKMLIDPLGITEPVAAFNGGVLVHPDLSVMTQSFVRADNAAKVIDAITRHGLDCWVYTDRDWLVRDANGPHVARERDGRLSSPRRLFRTLQRTWNARPRLSASATITLLWPGVRPTCSANAAMTFRPPLAGLLSGRYPP
jgi:hydroxymethylpyrimidine pyrophosphatase-like HAD family hydrolase